MTYSPVPVGNAVKKQKRRGLRYGGSEKREGRRFVGRQVLRGSDASHLILEGNGHGHCLNEKVKAERTDGAEIVSILVTCRESRAGPASGESAGHRGRFDGGCANGGYLFGARVAHRCFSCGGKRLERQYRDEDSPEDGSGGHFKNFTVPHPCLAIEIAMNSH